VVDAAVETARPAIDIKAHHVSIELPPQPLQIVVDPLRLSQVLANLLTNAAKYTDAGGQIRIRGSQIDGEIVIAVADNGIGIPADFRDRIFTMFSQVKATQERSDGGLGIGLALSKGLVELHGGTIEANSNGAGTGSEFIVRLPMRSSAVTRSKDPGPLAGRSATPRRVLLADDNCDAADTLATLLRIEGHEVTVVHDGQSALDRFDAIQPEVMLLDIGMPGLSGYDVARSVRRGTLGRAVTLIAITGWGQDSDKDRALTAGFNHHLTKPVEPDQLLRLLALDRTA
jgi:CheY-like chemotaxis protein